MGLLGMTVLLLFHKLIGKVKRKNEALLIISTSRFKASALHAQSDVLTVVQAGYPIVENYELFLHTIKKSLMMDKTVSDKSNRQNEETGLRNKCENDLAWSN